MRKIENLAALLFVDGWDVDGNYRESARIKDWQMFGDVKMHSYTKPVYGEIEPGKPVVIGGEGPEIDAYAVQAKASLEYYKGAGFVMAVSSIGQGQKVDYYMIANVKIRNPKTEARAIAEFEKEAGAMMEAKKAEAGITAPGEIKDMMKI